MSANIVLTIVGEFAGIIVVLFFELLILKGVLSLWKP